MRLRFCFLVAVLTGISFAQDTNFSVGPQYLINNASPLFLQPIATPSLSFSPGLADPYATPTQLAPSQISSRIASPWTESPVNIFLGSVYWGVNPPSEIVGLRVDTPSVSVDQIATYTYSPANVSDFVPYPPTGPASLALAPSVVELLSSVVPTNLPPSIVDAGVTGTADVQSLLNRGYGLPLGDFAKFLKSRSRHAARVFTNEDLQRK